MARIVNIHPESPQQRLLVQAAEFIRKAPSSPCQLIPATRSVAISATRKRWTDPPDSPDRRSPSPDADGPRPFRDRHLARVDNAQYRLLKATTPGSYTFILEGSRNCRAGSCIPSARPSACVFRIIP
jgi:hypothetical protein